MTFAGQGKFKFCDGIEYASAGSVRPGVKTPLQYLLVALILATSLTNCTTAYDAYGRPQQVVTPEGAVLGAAAVGLLAYGLANNNNDRRHYRSRGHYHRSSYGHSHHHRGGYGYY